MRIALLILIFALAGRESSRAASAVLLTSPYTTQTNFTLAAIHAHSLISPTPDPAGNFPVADVAKHFGDTNGFGAYTITDHDIFTTNNNFAAGVFITGQEVTRGTQHTIVWFTTNKIAGGYLNEGANTPQGILDDAVAHGGLAGLAHPNATSYRWRTNDALSKTNWQYIEVLNSLSWESDAAQGLAEDVWDWLLTAGRRSFGYTASDMHTVYATNGFNQVFLSTTNEASVKAAMVAGNLVFGRNLKMRVSTTNATIYADTHGVSSTITWIKTGGIVFRTTSSATSDSYTPDGTESYVRLKAVKTGESGAMSFSQPIYVTATNWVGERDIVAGTLRL